MREARVDTNGAYIEIDGRKFPFGDAIVLRSFAGPARRSLPLVYVGHGWVVPDRGIDPYAGLDVRGKLVVAHGPRALPKGVEIRQIGRVAVGASSPQDEAARRGAAGVVFIPQTTALKNWEQMRGQSLSRREMEPSVPSAYAAHGDHVDSAFSGGGRGVDGGRSAGRRRHRRTRRRLGLSRIVRTDAQSHPEHSSRVLGRSSPVQRRGDDRGERPSAERPST